MVGNDRGRSAAPRLIREGPKASGTPFRNDYGPLKGSGRSAIGLVLFIAHDFYIVSLKVEHIGRIISWTMLAESGRSI